MTNERVNRELVIERLALDMADERIETDISRNGLSGTAGGKGLIHRAVREAEDFFTVALKEWLDVEEEKKRKSAAHKFITVLPIRSLVYLASRTIINALAVQRVSYHATVKSLAREVLMAAGAELYRQKDEVGFERLSRQLNWQSREYVRRRIASEAFHNACIEIEATDSEELAIGTVLTEIFCKSTGLFEIHNSTSNRNLTDKSLRLTDRGERWLKDAIEANRLACPYHLPMVIPPCPWTTLDNGGYLLQNLHSASLIRTKESKVPAAVLEADLTEVMKAVNGIQSTAWRINKPILEVWRHFAGTGLAGCSSREDIEIPEALPQEDEGFSARQSLRREAYEARKDNAAKICVELQKHKMADIFENEPEMYYPHNLDFRGRVYPLAGLGAINPQGDDSGKALLQFAQGKPLGEDGVQWLFIHTQNVWGNDKVSLQERIDATHGLLPTYIGYAVDPLRNHGWMEADKPFSFLAACYELLGFSISGVDHVSHIAVALDGSCSGLQHFAGIMLDTKTAEAVNVVSVGGSGSADIYTKVSEEVNALIDTSTEEDARFWRGKVFRDLVKQPVMTLSYGVTLSGMRNQIIDKCKKLTRKGKSEYKDGAENTHASYLANCIHTVIGDVATAAFDVMGWLGEAAMAKAKIIDSLDGALSWTTPIGFPVVQEYYEYGTKRVEIMAEGRRVTFSTRTGAACIKASKQKQGAAPNFVHSMDATHLMLTVNSCLNEGLDSFAMIHDSFGTHPCDTGTLFEVLRLEFTNMYQHDVLRELYDGLPEVVRNKLAPPPARGDLDLNRVQDSEFFFA